MKNKKTNSKRIKKRKKSSHGQLPFDLDSCPWWKKLFIKIFLTHESKYVDKILDIGCLLWLFMLMGIIIYIAIWVLNFQEKYLY